MDKDQLIRKTEEFVRKSIEGYDSGHDWWHIVRVRNLALYINECEKMADPFTIEITALLHDTVDSKFYKGDSEIGYKMIEEFMDNAGMANIRDQVVEVIRNVSFSNKNRTGNLTDPILLIIQDADKLDAIGAIGVARAFNYGGFRNNAIYDPGDVTEEKASSTIGHFYDKLLRLKDMMNTETGRRLSGERHQFLEKFLREFYKEWDFGT